MSADPLLRNISLDDTPGMRWAILQRWMALLANNISSGGAGLPSQTGNNGKFLTTDGTTASWATVSGTGDVVAAGNNTLSGANSFSGLTTFSGAIIGTYTAMPALAVDVTKWGNSYSATGDVTFTYSNATPTAGTTTRLRITADGTQRTVTIPSTWSITRGGNITSLVVPANTVAQYQLQYVSSRWEIIGDPAQTNGTGNFLLSAGTAAIASGKTLTVSNTLTFTGTDSSSVAFGAGGTVLYSGGPLGTPSSATLTNATGLPEGGLSLTDITTGNVSTSKHGFAPKAPNDATKYLDGTGAWSVPAGGGGGGDTVISPTQITGGGDTANWNPTGLSTATIIRIDADANLNQISGIVAQSGHRLRLVNVSANTIIIRDQLAGLSTSTNRFANGGYDLPLFPGDSLDVTNDATSGVWRPLNGAGRVIPPSGKGYYVNSNYVGGLGGSSLMNFAGANTGTGSGASAFIAGSGYPVPSMYAETGTDTTGKAMVQGNNGNNFIIDPNFYWRLGFKIQCTSPSDGTTTYTIRAGFSDQASGSDDATDGCYLRYTHSVNSGNWVLVLRNNSSGVESTTNLSAGPSFGSTTVNHIAIIVSPTKVEVWQNGVNIGSTTTLTNLPTSRNTDITFAIAKSAGASDRQLNISAVELIGYAKSPTQ